MKQRQPWYVTIFSGLSAWVSAILFMTFLGIAGLFPESVPSSFIAGIMALGFSLYLDKEKNGVFRGQISLAASVAGHFWIIASVTRFLDFSTSIAIPITCGILWAILYIPKESQTHRFFSSLLLWITFVGYFLWHTEDSLYFLIPLQWITATCVMTTGISIKIFKVSDIGKPFVYAALSSGFFLLALLHMERISIQVLPVSLILGVLAIYVIATFAGKDQLFKTPHVFAAFAISLLSLIAPPGLIAAIGAGILGYGLSDRIVTAMAISFSPVFIFLFYYDLNVSLGLKSWILIGSGLILLTLRKLAFSSHSQDRKELRDREKQLRDEGDSFHSLSPGRKRIHVGVAIGILLIVNGMIISKELVLKNGESILLPLIPVDPRSLMQGDYMVLRYALADDLEKSLVKIPSDGKALVTVDSRGVATYKALYNGETLEKNERIISFKRRAGDIRFGAESFFFQEGHGKYYEKGTFGELKVNADGSSVLVGLCDKHCKKIVPPSRETESPWVNN